MSASAGTEVAARADFSAIRYAQCWEDASVLRAGLATRSGDLCLSIASAGDNAVALLIDDPTRVVAVDLSPAQLACVALRIAAYRTLEHAELLELVGSRPSERRGELYRRCRSAGGLPPEAAAFWDARPEAIASGIGSAGRFERYLRLFATRILPFVHRRATRRELLRPRDPEARTAFYDGVWNTWRWRLLFRVFFSRAVMGALGRDASFFRYVEGSVGERILARARHALRTLDPAANPYLHWIMEGFHGDALPPALEARHFETIRDRVDRIELRRGSIEDWLADRPRGAQPIDRANLSDIFEYMSGASSEALLLRLVEAARPGARFLYWNMLVPRAAPPSLTRLRRLDELAATLHAEDRAFFYSRLVIEEVQERET